MKKVSSSFVTGAIALVFAVLGYQTALLVHYSATARIIADRDSPDTVFVYETDGGKSSAGGGGGGSRDSGRRGGRDGKKKNGASGQGGGSNASGGGGKAGGDALTLGGNKGGTSGGGGGGAAGSSVTSRKVRKNAEHSPVAQRYRRSIPPASVETFRFNPNNVSVEDLMRLGFSAKQAASIDGYRAKGGRFRRKEDFARSYAVSDSIYRRLEAFIDIPLLDINEADSAAFDTLPGIGGYFARKMVEHRRMLGGYSYPEQLMDIYHFDESKFAKIKDLITLSHPYAYPLWTLPEDSLRHHPYIRTASAARSIRFFRENNPRENWSVKNLAEAGILTSEQAEKLSRCVVSP